MTATEPATEIGLCRLRSWERPRVPARLAGTDDTRPGRVDLTNEEGPWVEVWDGRRGWCGRFVTWPELLETMNDPYSRPLVIPAPDWID